jgi:general secretion pathway protein B
MSFILDALKKSESDRQRNANPGMYELKVAVPRARFPVWAIVLAFLLGINLLVGVWYLMKTDQPTRLKRDETAAPALPAPALPAPALPAPALPAPALPAPAAAPVTPEVERTDIARGIFNPADFEPAVEPEKAPPAAVRTVPRETRPPAASARRPATQGLPSRDDLILEGVTVPDVSMSLHVYDPDPARRFAFINGNRVQEGAVLPNGIRVQSITPEGAILLWQDRRFLLALP